MTTRKNTACLHETVKDEELAVQVIRGKEHLHNDRLCPSCGQAMRLERGGKAWRCFKKSCRKELSIRNGKWFGAPRHLVKFQEAKQITVEPP